MVGRRGGGVPAGGAGLRRTAGTRPLHEQSLAEWHPLDAGPERWRPDLRAIAAALDAMRDAALMVDSSGRLLWANRALWALTGIAPDIGLGKQAADVLAGPTASAELRAKVLQSLIGSDAIEIPVKRADGSDAWLRVRRADGAPVRTSGAPLSLVVAADVTEQRAAALALHQAHARFDHQARHDPLTGLPNRAYLVELASTALVEAADADKDARVGLCMIDLEHFKELNDTLGHTAGDVLLREAAELMRRNLSPGQSLARVGGDSFCVLCPELYDTETLGTLARALLDAITRPMTLDGRAWNASASIGIACAEPGERDAEHLLGNAEIALVDVKANNRGGVGLFSPAIGKQFADRARISEELRHAVAADAFVPYFQPQIFLDTDELAGFETLVRWRHPAKGVLEPCYFLETAGEIGLLPAIDTTMLDKALDGLVALRAAGHHVPRISINLSATSLREADRVELFEWAVDRRGLATSDVVVELLETTLITDADDPAIQNIDRLAAAGFGVELDDFGTGYACLSNLARLKIHALKIDRSLIHPMTAQRASAAIVRAIITLADQLGMNVLAEGIERPEEASALREFGCKLGQGFAFGRPMPLEEVQGWLAAREAAASPLHATG